MKIPIDDIYEFHKLRTMCHVASVNYFAGLVGYHFPEHDNDKNIEPMRTGYAYKNYAGYHPHYKLPDNYSELFDAAHDTHHAHVLHHTEYYGGDVARVPDVYLIEMVCDWFSAHFEQAQILHDCEYKTVAQWFAANMANKNWTDAQLKTIKNIAKKIEQGADKSALMAIWAPVAADVA